MSTRRTISCSRAPSRWKPTSARRDPGACPAAAPPVHAPDFTQPLARLRDCHRRIERFFGHLRSVVERCRSGRLAAADRPVLETALNYLDQAARRHTQDEEQSLFPRLRRGADPSIRAWLAELDVLEADHRRVAARHRQLDRLGRRWLAVGRLATAELVRWRGWLDELTEAYTAHIRCEDERVFVLAARVLTPADRRAIGAEMARRRAADPGPAGSRCAQRRRQTLGTSAMIQAA